MALGVEQAMEGPPGTVRTAEICAFIPCRKGEGLVTIGLVCHIATVERGCHCRECTAHVAVLPAESSLLTCG